MTSHRWSILVSVLVFALVLATAGSAQAQFGSRSIPIYPPAGQFGLGYGTGAPYGISPYGISPYGVSPFASGTFGVPGYGGFGQFGVFPSPGYLRSIGRRPQTTTSFQPLYNAITSLPGW